MYIHELKCHEFNLPLNLNSLHHLDIDLKYHKFQTIGILLIHCALDCL